MKKWFRLTLVCGVLVGLLLSLTQAVGLNYLLPVVDSGRWLDRGGETASDASTVSFIRSREFHLARAGPLESLVFDCALTAANLGPPAQEYGRPELIGPLESCRSSRQLKSTPSRPSSAKLLAQPTEFE